MLVAALTIDGQWYTNLEQGIVPKATKPGNMPPCDSIAKHSVRHLQRHMFRIHTQVSVKGSSQFEVLQ